jgi:hypothetical protein
MDNEASIVLHADVAKILPQIAFACRKMRE